MKFKNSELALVQCDGRCADSWGREWECIYCRMNVLEYTEEQFEEYEVGLAFVFFAIKSFFNIKHHND